MLHCLLPSPRYPNLPTAQGILYPPGLCHSPQNTLARNPKEQISPALPAARAAQFPSKPGNSYCAEVPATSQPLITAPSMADSEKFQPKILRTSHTLMFQSEPSCLVWTWRCFNRGDVNPATDLFLGRKYHWKLLLSLLHVAVQRENLCPGQISYCICPGN